MTRGDTITTPTPSIIARADGAETPPFQVTGAAVSVEAVTVIILEVRGRKISPAASRSLLHADHSPLHSSQMLVDTAVGKN